MRISDWSSDVCSSDLPSIAVRWRHEPDPRNASDPGPSLRVTRPARNGEGRLAGRPSIARHQVPDARQIPTFALPRTHGGPAGKRVATGKSVTVRVDLGGRRTSIKKQKSFRYDTTNEIVS